MFHSDRLQPCRYLQLPEPEFLSRVQPRPLNNPRLLQLNQPLAQQLGLSERDFDGINFADHLATPSLPEPIQGFASAYSGHQFGQFNPTLGDGRAMFVGEIHDLNGVSHELQLKGSGPTPFSRGFDGRAVIRSVVREYLASEAMEGLDIPTTRALAIAISDTPVFREQPEQAAIMIRTAPSHLRFGSFEHFYSRGMLDHLRRLSDFCIDHYFPECRTEAAPYAAWFEAVVQRTARLMAQWQAVGFCHGVMNTDNFSILGLTLDYGPYGFLDQYDPEHICNHSDGEGRYAYQRQPGIGYWNCLCLAQALSPLLDSTQIENALAQYEAELQSSYLSLMRAKLGLSDSTDTDKVDADNQLIRSLLDLLTDQPLDYSRFFRGLSYLHQPEPPTDLDDWLIQTADPEAVKRWLSHYQQHLSHYEQPNLAAERADNMAATNPKFILRNHLAQQAIEKAEQGDNTELERMTHLLQRPFDEHPRFEQYAAPSPDWAKSICVSCSS
ncbi:YdiU family protein [Motiliproteus coralliicola]|uniref:Protein nucleotidyltransferase YdiU n=1 Tax=Motiliproteus coralliicola TaxID=2283196 RepID=A0A369WRA5_9GAMM|nr:YdiU family protein [Motiliproteus coralliicola]RDE24222.1 YdiU family protein [Motiliproteus coralliicola]